MFEGVNSVASRVCPTSHLFSCRMDNLKMSRWRTSSRSLILAKHLDLMAYRQGQSTISKEFRKAHSGGCFTSANMSSPIGLTKGHIGFFESKKLDSSNATTSIWVRSILFCTGHKEGKVGLFNAYFLLVLPTQCIRSSWQNQNLCSSIDTPWAGNQ